MGVVNGKIPFREDDEQEAVHLPFGQWLLKTIIREAETEEWAVKRESKSERHIYVWLSSLETAGKNADHFRDKEHLHLIDNGTDVDISTKHPQALTMQSDGTYEKRTASDKEPQHLTGTKALNRGASLPITVCTKNAPPDDVVDWQKTLIADLRKTTLGWLREVANEQQVREFTS